jgi:hypothetical protein
MQLAEASYTVNMQFPQECNIGLCDVTQPVVLETFGINSWY